MIDTPMIGMIAKSMGPEARNSANEGIKVCCKSRPERACNCAAVKAASCSDGTATDCTLLMRHMVIEIHWSDGGTLSN
jgi:hypothetical protein